MSMTCETVRKVDPNAPGGFVIINKEDMDEGDTLFMEDCAKDESKPMTIAELKASLAEKGIEFPKNANKDDLQNLLDASEKVPE